MTIMKRLNQRRFKEAVALFVTLSLVWGLIPSSVLALAQGEGEEAAAEEVTEQAETTADETQPAGEEEAKSEETDAPEEPAVAEASSGDEEPAESDAPQATEDEAEPSKEVTPSADKAAGKDAAATEPLPTLVPQADTPTAVDEVLIAVSAPTAGETSSSAPGAFSLGSGYHVTTANWCDEEGNELGSTVTFVAGETYYLSVLVKAEEGYAFPQGSSGTTFDAEGGNLLSSSVTNLADSEGVIQSWAELVISVKATAASSFFGVLITDVDDTGNPGGSYWMDYPGMEGFPSRTSPSNNFVEDGGKVRLEAFPEDGRKFVGWYQGDPDKAKGKLYVGNPLSTNRTYEFDAPISLARPYICAVFEQDDSPQGDQVQMWVGNTKVIGSDSSAQGGKVAVKYTPSSDVYSGITAKDGTNYVAGEVLQFYKGDECTVYQQADEGFRFVGWYHVSIEWAPGETLAWEGEAISTEASFTYKPGVTVVAGDSEPLRYVCAVFEKDAVETYTVSFDPGTGQGSMDSATVKAGEEYELPSCGFTHANPARTFYKWSVDGELKSPGDTITVSKDTEVIAQWLDTGRAKTIDTSVDRSNSEVVGTLLLTDTRTGKVTEVVAFDEVTASEFTQPSNPTVQAMIGEAKESAAAKAQEIAGGHEVTIKTESVSNPRIVKTIDNRTTTFFVNTDDAGDYSMYLIVDGEWAHHWRYDVTVEAEYESSVALTLHWSSVDGVDLMEPITIDTAPGTRLDDALKAAGKPHVDLFTKDGYEDYGYRSLNSFDSYVDEDAFYHDCVGDDYLIEGDVDIYVVMFKELDAVEISIVVPTCGSTDAPAVSVLNGECSLDRTPRWVKDAQSLEPYEDALVGGNEYLAEVWLVEDFHYFLADDVRVTVNGGEFVSAEQTPDGRLGVIAKVAVEHDPADSVNENVTEPTCTKAGSHDEVVYCEGCGDEISRKTVEDAALGHDWGAWVVDIEATDEAEGLQHRACTRCKEVEEQVIPKVKVAYQLVAGAGQTHVLGDGSDLSFTFKRNVRDEVAFDHFGGVRVDGKLLSDKAYVAKAGSVVVTLNASYLDTLAVGEHTMTAQFDDADDVDVTFTVASKEEPAPTPEPKKDDAKPSKGKALPQTGDVFALVSLVSLTLALLGLAMTLAGRRIHDC